MNPDQLAGFVHQDKNLTLMSEIRLTWQYQVALPPNSLMTLKRYFEAEAGERLDQLDGRCGFHLQYLD